MAGLVASLAARHCSLALLLVASGIAVVCISALDVTQGLTELQRAAEVLVNQVRILMVMSVKTVAMVATVEALKP